MEPLIQELASAIARAIEAAAVLTIGWGAIEAFIRLVGVVARGGSHGARKDVWRRLGVWLLLGLEFELAADIIKSVVSPSWQDIGRLGAIAAIRTFLNHFLERDLENTAKAGAGQAGSG